jgi:hypothetical protein
MVGRGRTSASEHLRRLPLPARVSMRGGGSARTRRSDLKKNSARLPSVCVVIDDIDMSMLPMSPSQKLSMQRVPPQRLRFPLPSLPPWGTYGDAPPGISPSIEGFLFSSFFYSRNGLLVATPFLYFVCQREGLSVLPVVQHHWTELNYSS